jgi:hypothetical protein
MNQQSTKDPLTGEPFIPKRVNQRFASASNRKKFNNQQANALRKKRAIIYGPLNKTHLLLLKLMNGKNEGVFSYDFLEGYGIQFKIFTHFKIKQDFKYNCVFEFLLILDSTTKTVKIYRNGGL